MQEIDWKSSTVYHSLFFRFIAKISTAGEHSLEELDSDPWIEFCHLRDLSKLKPRKIRFVEVIKDIQK